MARPALKKSAIEAAALSLFAARGVPDTTIKDIALRAGVAEGALYRHYPGKNEMAVALFKREVEKFGALLSPLLFDPSRSLRSRLRSSIRFMYRYYRDYPVEFTFILMTQHGFPERQILRPSLNPNDLVIRFVKDAPSERSPRRDPVLLAALLMGAVLQPAVMHRYGRLKTHPLSLADKVTLACERLLEIERARA